NLPLAMTREAACAPSGVAHPRTDFRYDAAGQRIVKQVGGMPSHCAGFEDHDGAHTEIYVRGLDGSVLAVYGDGELKSWNILAGGTVIGRVERHLEDVP